MEQITAVFTSLTAGGDAAEQSEVGVSSLMDTWLLLRNIEYGGERNRGLYILKSRGMAHSNQVREFVLSDKGINLVDVYVGPGEVLTGSARLAQESRDQAEALARQERIAQRRREVERKQLAIEAQIAALRADMEVTRKELEQEASQEALQDQNLARNRSALAAKRMADPHTDLEIKGKQRRGNSQ